jgi:hypothetical protein
MRSPRSVLPAWHAFASGPRTAVTYRSGDGVESTVPLSRAGPIAYENCLPVRVIPDHVGQCNTPGDYWSATTRQLVAYESWLESKWLTLLDFDVDITAIVCQPFTLDGVDDSGVWTHTPDIFARRSDGSVLLLDVKHQDRANNPEVVAQTRRTRVTCDTLKWDYALVCEPDPQLWATVSWLAGFRRDLHAGRDYVARLLGLAKRPAQIATLCAWFEVPELARSALFHLCWTQQLVFDLSQPLRDSTLVHTRGTHDAYHIPITGQADVTGTGTGS